MTQGRVARFIVVFILVVVLVFVVDFLRLVPDSGSPVWWERPLHTRGDPRGRLPSADSCGSSDRPWEGGAPRPGPICHALIHR